MKNSQQNQCIKLEKVNKTYGTQHVLKDVSISVPYHSVYGLLGPSGCGKTTTVKIISGILNSDENSGHTLIENEPMPDLSLMKRIGYMAQEDALYQVLSGKENLEFFGMLYGLKGDRLNERVNHVLSLVNLLDHKDKPVSAYSGGMKRRLSLATALIHEPEVLILDEPTVGIDPVLRKTIWEEFYRLADSGKTILVTTHVMDEAEKCTNLAMMRDGRILTEGTPDSLMKETGLSSLEQVFLKYGTREEDEHENQGIDN